jgi:hypothetical protein
VNPTVIDPRLVLAMTRKKIAVKTISTSMTVPSPNPPATCPPFAMALGEWDPYPLDAKPDALALKPLMLSAIT